MTNAQPARSARKRRARGLGEGAIFKRVDRRTRADGTVGESVRWCALADLGFRGGQRARKILYGHDRAEVAEKLTVILGNRSRGVERLSTRRAPRWPSFSRHGSKTSSSARDARIPTPCTRRRSGDTSRQSWGASVEHAATQRHRRVDSRLGANRACTANHPPSLGGASFGARVAVRTDRLAVNPASRPSLPRVE